MEKIYVVCWANSYQNDWGNCSANVGVDGVFTSLDSAKLALEKSKQEFLDEQVYTDLSEEEREDLKVSIQVYGSVEEGYFEIDYDSFGIRSEIRIEIIEKEIQD